MVNINDSIINFVFLKKVWVNEQMMNFGRKL